MANPEYENYAPKSEESILADAQRRQMEMMPCNHPKRYEHIFLPGQVGCLLCELAQLHGGLAGALEMPADSTAREMLEQAAGWRKGIFSNGFFDLTGKLFAALKAPEKTTLEQALNSVRELAEYRRQTEKRVYPFVCHLCNHQIEDESDLIWHGLGNCAELCSRCTGSGEEPKIERTPGPTCPIHTFVLFADCETCNPAAKTGEKP